jgi:hypothetical protein
MADPELDAADGGMSSADAERWRAACTLADLGELTAQWLEGKIRSFPGILPGFGPDEETIHLIPVLATVNRAGFVTEFSQPGMPGDEGGWAQRAAISGYANDGTFATLCAAVVGADLMITAGRAGDEDWGTSVTVTLENGEANTATGGAKSRLEIADGYGRACSPVAVDVLGGAWQVALIDPVWGRDDQLWPLLEAFAARRKER